MTEKTGRIEIVKTGGQQVDLGMVFLVTLKGSESFGCKFYLQPLGKNLARVQVDNEVKIVLVAANIGRIRVLERYPVFCSPTQRGKIVSPFQPEDLSITDFTLITPQNMENYQDCILTPNLSLVDHFDTKLSDRQNVFRVLALSKDDDREHIYYCVPIGNYAVIYHNPPRNTVRLCTANHFEVGQQLPNFSALDERFNIMGSPYLVLEILKIKPKDLTRFPDCIIQI